MAPQGPNSETGRSSNSDDGARTSVAAATMPNASNANTTMPCTNRLAPLITCPADRSRHAGREGATRGGR